MILADLEKKFSGQYSLVKVSEIILDDVFEIMKQNKYFFSRTQMHEVTRAECREDIYALPPNTDLSQKFYIAFYNKKDCIAVLDYIEGYPDAEVVYLGLFMLNPKLHRTGVGSQIINNFAECAQSNGFTEIKLGCYQDNDIGYAFWKHMGFTKEKVTSRENDGKIYNLIQMQKVI